MADERITNPSARTIAERNKFLSSLDAFATFRWANVDMLDNFGVFIINEKKGSLKIYNGASFSNNYTKQQFQDGYTNLSGVTFNTQQISFTIGVYWISIEDYRVLMNLLHPYAVEMLSFSFEPKYGYKCKLSNIKDSTRYIVGKEGAITSTSNSNLQVTHLPDGDGSGYRYYTELQLTFDVIGAQCARQITPTIIPWVNDSWISLKAQSSLWPSDLEFPVTIECSDYIATTSTAHIKMIGYIYNTTSETQIGDALTLFDVGLQNLVVGTTLSFTYNSEQGILYWRIGDKQQLLSLLSINNEGRRFVQYLSVNRFFVPGRLDYPEVINNNYDFRLQLIIEGINSTVSTGVTTPATYCIAAARTNII